jgi:hypothetical protein
VLLKYPESIFRRAVTCSLMPRRTDSASLPKRMMKSSKPRSASIGGVSFFFREQMAHCCKLCIVLKAADIVFLLMLILPLEEKEVVPWYLKHGEKYGPIQSATSCTCPTCPRGTAGHEPNASQSRVEGDHTPDAATPGTIKRFQGEDEGLAESLRVEE